MRWLPHRKAESSDSKQVPLQLRHAAAVRRTAVPDKPLPCPQVRQYPEAPWHVLPRLLFSRPECAAENKHYL